ncbi:hypothetical protein GOP47_0026363 [Adiantum capillus-veneris]|nr:hypothetical protein GOP47_0026363 [Adiantum capillus-veneris]
MRKSKRFKIFLMAPKRSMKKREENCSGGMTVQSGTVQGRSIDGASNSNAITPNTIGPSFALNPQTTHTEINNQDEEDDFSNHNRRKELLHMMILIKVKDSKGGHFADYKKLRAYMRQETYWQGMFGKAAIIIAKFEVEGPMLPKTFEVFLKATRKTQVSLAYTHVLANMKSASDYASLPEVMHASKRLVYRWLLNCMRLRMIESMPEAVQEWLDKEDDNTMFSSRLLKKGITPWECSHCPWWLEYPLGVIPKSEQEIHARFLKESPISNDGVIPPQATHIEPSTKPPSHGRKGDVNVVPEWNHFSTALASGVMEIADVHLADEGFLVTLSLAQHLGDLAMQANRVSLQLHRSWTSMCDGGYLHPKTGEQVMDLTLGLFYYKNAQSITPHYDRKDVEDVSLECFSASRSYLTESPPRSSNNYTRIVEDDSRGSRAY